MNNICRPFGWNSWVLQNPRLPGYAYTAW